MPKKKKKLGCLVAEIMVIILLISYRNAVSHVQCHCCNAKSTVPFHFLGHECRACGSFNTAVVQTLGLPDIGSAGAACCSPGSGSGDEDSNMDCSD